MEGVRVFETNKLKNQGTDPRKYVEEDMKQCLEGMVNAIFGKVQVR